MSISKLIDEQTLGPGDFFATVSMLTSREHSNTAIAETDVSLIAIQKNQFQDIADKNKPVAMKVLMEFSSFIRNLNAALMGIPESSAVGKGEKTPVANFAASESNVRSFASGAAIFKEGDPSNEILIIKKGMVKLTKNVEGNEVTLSYLKDGEIFGEMGMLESKPRSANAYAYGNCEIVTLSDAQIITQPQIFMKLCTLLAQRSWFLLKQLTNRRIKDAAERLCDMLVVNLKKESIIPSIRGHTFYFSPKQLIEMSGLPSKDGLAGIEALTYDGLIQTDVDQIIIKNIAEIYRRNEIYWKLAR
jgi:CRP-like cAMP-binding protein